MDNVNHPKHYETGPFECIELTSKCGFCVGNAAKYVWRHNDKNNPTEDLKKAKWYIEYAESHPYARGADQWPAGMSKELAELEILKFAQVPDFWKAMRREDLEGMKKAVEARLSELEEQ